MASSIKVVVSFDFGTTYSGVSYACRKPGQQPNPSPVCRWPGDSAGRVSNDVKVPTIISYNGLTDFKWGYQVKLTDKSIVGIKLLLDPDQDKPSYLPGSGKRTALRSLPKPAVDIAADYIGAVYNHALQEIRKGSVGSFFDTCERDVVLTVPAVWSDKAKDLTLQAATKAGLGSSITMIKEPEAAAIYTLSEQTLALNKDDIYVICDAGGGTVDLITYEVSQVYPLDLAEVVPGSGGMAGAIGLNKRFEDSVRDLIGEAQMAALKAVPDGWSLVLDQFETEIKRKFCGESDRPHYIHFPGVSLEDDLNYGLENNTWCIKWNDLQEIFDPLVQHVVRLVDDQVLASLKKAPLRPIKAIFLVGGFGSNGYLKACMEKGFPGTQIIQPADASSAIMNGAVIYRLAHGPRVVSRQATCHYGVKVLYPKRTPEDDGRETFYDPRDGITRVEGMDWHITKGQELTNEKIKISVFAKVNHPYDFSDLSREHHLWFSKMPSPQVYPDDKVVKCCRLKSLLWPARHTMKKIPFGANGKPYWTIDYDLVVSAKANLEFSVEIKGKEYGSVEASYE
ncbi:Hsp70 family heat shock protein [Apiospora arundinis]|uniref:Hsp70 family heat shock protein n=1 Tax=Apiospora arundinis TaxID=335852 RepID=A0ABR2JHT7_9PEZI